MSEPRYYTTVQGIKVVCERLGVQGTPNFLRYSAEERNPILTTIALCQSFLEIRALIGAFHYLQGGSFTVPSTLRYKATAYPELGPGISIFGSETWMKSGVGFHELVIVPQYQIQKIAAQRKKLTLTQDFALFIPRNITHAGKRFYHIASVEVDGYETHRFRRDEDAKRDKGLTYPVIRVKEEHEDFLEWFRFVDPGHSCCVLYLDKYGEM